MIKRTLYFGNSTRLKAKDEQLLVIYPNEEKTTVKVPIEDIGVVILDHWDIMLSQFALNKMLENNVAVVSCNEKHMPKGMFLNLDGHHTQSKNTSHQIEASLPIKKNLWQQTIRYKIHNQAMVLHREGVENGNMKQWSLRVGSGDPENIEGRAAAYYWKKVFAKYNRDFKRDKDGELPNALLNYGYAILRAVVARSLVASGLLPTLGIHHRNKYNAYCLADDIMEPYRPYVDLMVLELIEEGALEEGENLNPTIKKRLLQIPVLDVVINGKKSPLLVGMQKTTASLAACFEGKTRKLKYPLMDEFRQVKSI